MKILVTGSEGHLGEALVRTLRGRDVEVVSVDIKSGPHTTHPGSIVDPSVVANCMTRCDAVIHTATLHKPHVATHSRQDFVDTNITGTLNLLEEARRAEVSSFVFTSTTSVFGHALVPPPGAPAAWITEKAQPIPKNIYGVTKLAAENLCELFARNFELPSLVLRTSRFFPEEDDNKDKRETYDGDNAKANEFLYRRVDVEDVVGAHLLALEKAERIKFGRYIISATPPFSEADLQGLRDDAPMVVQKYHPFKEEYAKRQWTMFPSIDRVYVNEKARRDLDWKPKYTFAHILQRLAEDKRPLSPLAESIGRKGYHAEQYEDGIYPVE